MAVLRILHALARHDFHTRYVHHDLPAAAGATLRRLTFVRDLDPIRRGRAEAERLLFETWKKARATIPPA